MSKITEYTKRLKDALAPVASTVLLIASILSLAFDPIKASYEADYMEFDRTIGIGTLAGVNSELRIKLYMFFYLIFIPLCVMASMILCSCFVRSIKEKLDDPDIKEALEFLDASSICALILVLIFIINKYTYINADIINSIIVLTIPVVVSICTLFFLRFPVIRFKVYRFGMILSLSFSLFINFMLQTNTESSLYRFYIIYAITSVIVQLILARTRFKDFDRLAFAAVPLTYAMLIAGISLELFNVLNRHNIFIIDRLASAKLVFAALVVLSVLLFALAEKGFLKKLKTYPHWETISLIGIILSFVYFGDVPPQSVVANSELFENANHGLLVDDFLNWGKFPIINSFDAHTMRHSLGGVLYGLFNNDVIGATYFQYNFVWNCIIALFSFVVFKNLFDKYFAFFIAVIVPIGAIFPLYMGFDVGVICIAAMLYALRKKSFAAYLMMFFSILLTLVFNIPTGFSYGGAVFITALVGIFVDKFKNSKTLKQSLLPTFLKALAIFAGIVIAAYVAICLQQNVNPIKRALEFLGIAMSTNNWSRPDIGDASTINYGLAYSFVPFAVVLCLLWLVTHFKSTKLWYATLAVFGAYVFNITRTLQRHTLDEGMLAHVLGLSLLGITLFFATYFYKHKRIVFAVSSMLLLLGLFNVDDVQNAVSPAARAINAFSDPANYYNGSEEIIERVDTSAPRTAYSRVLAMLDSVIPEGETYLDLTGQTMLYAFSEREKPVYANQSAAELSGEYSQRRIIEEVEEEYNGICDFALVDFDMWTMNIDGVSCFARYYIVLEYLYDNYRPLCQVDNFALWVRNERYEEFYTDDSDVPSNEVCTVPMPQEGSGFIANSLTAEFSGSLRLICGEIDPYIVIPLEAPVVLDRTDSVDYYVEMTFKSDAAGLLQLFYNFEGFNETDSSRVNISLTEDYTTIRVPVSNRGSIAELNGIRIDPPSDSVFDISSLKIVSIPAEEKMISLENPIFRADITDSNWTNGISNFDSKRMVFAREAAQLLIGAKELYTLQGSAEVTNVIVNENWIQIETDKEASFFDDGVTAVSTISKQFETIDYGYLGTAHSIELGQLPYIWGQFDTKEAWNNPLVQVSMGASGVISSDAQRQAKYAVISINSLSDGRATLGLKSSSGQSVTEFNFELNSGTNRYIIRCSADWAWIRGGIESFAVSTDVNAEVVAVSFLKGDSEDYEK